MDRYFFSCNYTMSSAETHVHLASAHRFSVSEEYLSRLRRIHIQDIIKINIFSNVMISVSMRDCPGIRFILSEKNHCPQKKTRFISPLSPEEFVAAKIQFMDPHLLHAVNLRGGNDLK